MLKYFKYCAKWLIAENKKPAPLSPNQKQF